MPQCRNGAQHVIQRDSNRPYLKEVANNLSFSMSPETTIKSSGLFAPAEISRKTKEVDP